MEVPGRDRFALRCVTCATLVSPEAAQPRCPHGHPVLEVEPDLEAARNALTAAEVATRPATLMRYAELLPFVATPPSMGPLVTPLVDAPGLARDLGLASVQIKDEGCQPSGSLKSRSSAIAAARASELGFDEIACASSGNAAVSMAAMAAAHGLRATAFVPDRIPSQKLTQLRAFSARVVVIEGAYEQAYALCGRACEEFGWYNRNSAQDPYLVEGKKTCGLEIGEQTASEPPDWVVVPVGDGCTITGIWKGLSEIAEIGIAPHAPRMLGVQAEASATVHDAWAESRAIEEVEVRYPDAATAADSIACTHPHNGDRAVKAVRESSGAMVTVSDDAMLEAMVSLAAAGVLMEPASAATLAGVEAALQQGLIEPGARVVVVGTGSGLKSLDQAAVALGAPPVPMEPTLDALRELVEAEGSG